MGAAFLRFVCKTDIRSYYASIDKMQLLHLVSRHVRCPVALDLLSQFLNYRIEHGGNFHTPVSGIPRSSPLSPLLAGLHLYELDEDLSCRRGVRYIRFMDDILILSRTRWQLKRAVAKLNHWFNESGLRQHPDKTYIGRVEHGFDWLGYRFAENGLTGITPQAFERFRNKLCRLLEQARSRGTSHEATQRRVVEYIKRWCGATATPVTPNSTGLKRSRTLTYGLVKYNYPMDLSLLPLCLPRLPLLLLLQ